MFLIQNRELEDEIASKEKQKMQERTLNTEVKELILYINFLST